MKNPKEIIEAREVIVEVERLTIQGNHGNIVVELDGEPLKYVRSLTLYLSVDSRPLATVEFYP